MELVLSNSSPCKMATHGDGGKEGGAQGGDGSHQQEDGAGSRRRRVNSDDYVCKTIYSFFLICGRLSRTLVYGLVLGMSPDPHLVGTC